MKVPEVMTCSTAESPGMMAAKGSAPRAVRGPPGRCRATGAFPARALICIIGRMRRGKGPLRT